MINAPLAERMRPKTIDEVIGQEHLVGATGTIRKFLDTGIIPSMILWGPPGVGKTTLARIIAETSNRKFYKLSAINSGVKDIREIVDRVKNEGMFGTGNAILFIDEIHRFSKSQQDSLLEAVEKGLITLIGATTENPSFEVISALLSRCQVFVLKSLEKEDLENLLLRVLSQDEQLASKDVQVEEMKALLRISGGDARKLLNSIETVVLSSHSPVKITDELVLEVLNEKMAKYDKSGENHYDIISAFIKSIRGSDPHASVYWLARMVEGGEDPKFIARRLLILASEDIGNANPTALVLANNCFQAVSVIGWPESRIILSQCVNYLALSPKSNSTYQAIAEAQKLVRETGDLSVPLHLRNAPTKLMKDLGYGSEYQYPHSQEQSFVMEEYLPDEISGTTLFVPGDNPRESKTAEELKRMWKDKYD
jgi:putative ATPase